MNYLFNKFSNITYSLGKKLFDQQDTPTILIDRIRNNSNDSDIISESLKGLYELLENDKDGSLVGEALGKNPIPLILNAMGRHSTRSSIIECGCKILILFKNYREDYTKERIKNSGGIDTLEKIRNRFSEAISADINMLIDFVKGDQEEKTIIITTIGSNTENTGESDIEMEEPVRVTKRKSPSLTPPPPQTLSPQNSGIIKVEPRSFSTPDKKINLGSPFKNALENMSITISNEDFEMYKTHLQLSGTPSAIDHDADKAIAWYTSMGSYYKVLAAGSRAVTFFDVLGKAFGYIGNYSYTGPFYFAICDGYNLCGALATTYVPVVSSLGYVQKTLERMKPYGEKYIIVMLENVIGFDVTKYSPESEKESCQKILLPLNNVELSDIKITLDDCTKLVKAKYTTSIRRSLSK